MIVASNATLVSGGIRQRLGISSSKLADAAPEQACGKRIQPEGGDLEQFFKDKFKKGKLSAVELVQGSNAAPSTDSKLAKCAAGGKHPGNAHRDVMLNLGRKSKFPDVYSADLPLWNHDENQKEWSEAYFLLPYEVVDTMITDEDLEKLTNLRPDNPHKATIDDWRSKMGLDPEVPIAPCGLWGDSAPVGNRDSVTMLLFNILCANTSQYRFWVTALCKRSLCNCGCAGMCTFEEIWKVMAWAFAATILRIYPSVRHDGVPFAQSKRRGDKQRAMKATAKQRMKATLAPIQKRADWSWYKQILAFIGWKGEGATGRNCWKCFADHSTVPWTDFRLNALWRSRMMTHRDYITYVLNKIGYVPGIFSLPGFCIAYATIDLLHCGCLGVVAYLAGNVLFELFQMIGGLITSSLKQMGEISRMIKAASKAIGQVRPPMNYITLPMIKLSGKSPTLRAKGSEARTLLPVLRHIFENYFPPTCHRDELRLACIQKLDEVYKSIKAWTTESPKASECALYARQHLLLYSELATDALDRQTGNWRLYPKHHQFMHLMEDQITQSGCPNDFFTYADESEIGDAVLIAKTCHPLTAQRRIIERYRL